MDLDKHASKQSSKKVDYTVDLTRWGSLRLAPIILMLAFAVINVIAIVCSIFIFCDSTYLDQKICTYIVIVIHKLLVLEKSFLSIIMLSY